MIILFKLTLLLGLNRCWGWGGEGDMGGTDQTKKIIFVKINHK